MIPKENRLRTKADFAHLFKKGQIFHSKGISAKVGQNKLGLTRLGFVISTKVHKKAVRRNKVRRRLRTIFGRRLEVLKPGLDIAILARKEVLEMGFKELEAAAERLIQKAELEK
jgi:ribonuclease P protein component